MCFYRSTYYPSCRHQEVVLFDFCEEAATEQDQPKRHGRAGVLKSKHWKPHATRGGVKSKGKKHKKSQPWIESLAASKMQSSCRERAPVAPEEQHHHPSSTSDTLGSLSVIEKPAVGISASSSSLPLQTSSVQVSSADLSQPGENMVGLQGFNIRSWMSGSSAQPPEQAESLVEHVSLHFRLRIIFWNQGY